MTTYIVHRFGNGAGNKFFEHISRVLLLPLKTVFVHLVTLWFCTSSEREPKIASDFVCNRARIMQKRYIRLLGPVKAHWKLHWTNLNSEGKPISLSEEQIYRNIFTTLTRFDHNTHSYQWQDDRKKKTKADTGQFTSSRIHTTYKISLIHNEWEKIMFVVSK